MDEQPIDEIKRLLNRLYERVLVEFYELGWFVGGGKYEE